MMKYLDDVLKCVRQAGVQVLEIKRDDNTKLNLIEIDVFVKKSQKYKLRSALKQVDFVLQASFYASGYDLFGYFCSRTKVTYVIDAHYELGRFGNFPNYYKINGIERTITSDIEECSEISQKNLALFYFTQMLFYKGKHDKRIQFLESHETYISDTLYELGFNQDVGILLSIAKNKYNSPDYILKLKLLSKSSWANFILAFIRRFTILQQPKNIYSIMGVDGSGKSTVIRNLLKDFPNVATVYCGWKDFSRLTGFILNLKNYRWVSETPLRFFVSTLAVTVHYFEKTKRTKKVARSSFIVLCDRDPYDAMIDPEAKPAWRLRAKVLNWLLFFKRTVLIVSCDPLESFSRSGDGHSIEYHRDWSLSLKDLAAKKKNVHLLDVNNLNIHQVRESVKYAILEDLIANGSLRK